MYDPTKVYTTDDINYDVYFSSYSDGTGRGKVELHIPDEPGTLKLTIAAAEKLLTNLDFNIAQAKRYLESRITAAGL